MSEHRMQMPAPNREEDQYEVAGRMSNLSDRPEWMPLTVNDRRVVVQVPALTELPYRISALNGEDRQALHHLITALEMLPSINGWKDPEGPTTLDEIYTQLWIAMESMLGKRVESLDEVYP